MSRLSDLLRQVEGKDSQLAADLRREFEQLRKRRAFGLNFERHVPETVELPGRPVRKGDKVRFLAERGEAPGSVDQRIWQVASIGTEGSGKKAKRVAELVRRDSPEADIEKTSRAVDDLIVVAEFRDPIYPGLNSTGKVERGGDKPFHTVINAENYHALQALLYTHEGKVDAIYIDPPYNTGARDWKYNNDYVDTDDAYRHSKWLAMMERRLKLAKRLLNPDDSVLVVTIDEKEYLRLGLLLEQIFEGVEIQMVSSVVNPSGAVRADGFSRVDEYIYFVFLGASRVIRNTRDMLTESPETKQVTVWRNLIRDSGSTNKRADRWRQFYPVFVELTTNKIVASGPPIPLEIDRSTVQPPAGTVAVWPLRINGEEGFWQLGQPTFEEYRKNGFVRVGQIREDRISLNYLRGGDVKRVESGEIKTIGRAKSGELILDLKSFSRPQVPKSVWNLSSHTAPIHGSGMLRNFLPNRRFPYPKSLYAVEDTLRFFVQNKVNAVIVDFFSGSGTTAHAVMRLNKQDGGRRQCISVTNNEVSADEQKALRDKGLRPGDPKWEALGICEYITKPRIEAAITGRTPEGKPIKGDYKFTDEFPMADGFEENVEFFDLTYEAPRPIAHHRSFEAIAPLLWLKAGAQGRRIDKPAEGFDVADTYGVLFDLDASQDFIAAVTASETASMAFIITDDDRGFQSVCAELPANVEAVRLYESYLTNFVINTGRE